MTTPAALPPKISVLSLIDRVKDTKAQLGTITDKLALNQSEAANLPEFYQSDLTLFRYIVENGVMKSAEFRSPHGYKILDFLTMLCLMQEAERMTYEEALAGPWEAEREELIAIFETWSPEMQDEHLAWQEERQGPKAGDHIKLKTGETVEVVEINILPTVRIVTVKGQQGTYILHPMDIAL